MMFFGMRARNAADTDYLVWIVQGVPDSGGAYAPAAILTSSAVITASWGDADNTYFAMRARNAADTDYVTWVHEGLTADTAGASAPEAIDAGSAIVLAKYTGGLADVPDRDVLSAGSPSANTIIWPLTFDEQDSNGFNTLTRLGTGPHITPDGVLCNSYSSVYSLTTMPTWQDAAAETVSFHAVASTGILHTPAVNPKIVAGLCTTGNPKIEIAIQDDIVAVSGTQTQFVCRTTATTVGTLRLNRSQWRFEFRYPELLNGNIPAAQSVCWQDSDTLLISAHENDTTTVIYRVDAATGNYTGRATSTTLNHFNSMHLDQDGRVWGKCSGGVLRLDLATSFVTGEITSFETWDTGDVPVSSICFATVSATEYVLLGQYAESGTPRVHVFLRSQMAGTVNVVDRVKRFQLGLRCQDMVVRAADGLLYASRNIRTGDGSPTGWIQSYNLAAAIAGSDDAVLTAVASYPHAGEYVEGIDFHPVTGRVWANTEGLSAPSDQLSWSAVWTCSIPQVPEETSYLVDYASSTDALTVRLNGRLMWEATRDLTVAPTKLVIGGNVTVETYNSNVCSGDTLIRAVAMKDGPFTQAEFDDMQDGSIEALTLQAYPVTVLNPGAESTTTDWTVESAAGSSLANRAANPAPYAGASYFTGAFVSNTTCVHRQRFTAGIATVTGFSSVEVDEESTLREVWIRTNWQQAGFDTSSDPGGMGLRALTSADATINTTILTNTTSGGTRITMLPAQTWQPRGETLMFENTARGFDVIQSRLRTAGAGIDCYIDEISAVVYAQERDTGTTPVLITISADDSSATNANLAISGTAPLSVKGPMGTDFALAFGGARGLSSAANVGPVSTWTGTNWTWEGMVYVSEVVGAANIWVMGGAGETSAANFLFQLFVNPNQALTVFWEQGAGVNVTITSAANAIPIGRWVHLQVEGATNGANRDVTIRVTEPGAASAVVHTGSGTLATGGTTHTVQAGQFGAASPLYGKMAYVRISNNIRGATHATDAAADPVTNITNDGNTTGLYLMQERT